MANLLDGPLGYDPQVGTLRPHKAHRISSFGHRSLAGEKLSAPIPDNERRRWTRTEVRMEACLQGKEKTCTGLVQNISLGGVHLVFHELVPAAETQFIQMGLLTEAGVLEIGGIVRGLREGVSGFVQGFAIEFEPLDVTAELVLASLLNALHEGTVSIRLIGRLIPQETGDLLIEQTYAASGTAHCEAIHTDSPAGRNPADPQDENDTTAESLRVTSRPVECRNASGYRLAAYHDSPSRTLSGMPLVIISPGFGETKKEYITLAYYLVCNGFHVIRYDHSHHVGESSGDTVDTTLTGMREDLCAVVKFAQKTWPASPITVVASSLAGRVAMKAAAEDPGLDQLILLTGIVDVRSTLHAVHQEDLVGTYLQGVRRGVANILGFNVHTDHWLEDATNSGYADLPSTLRDARRIRIPVIFFSAEHDTWVRPESMVQVREACPRESTRWYVIPEALHRLNENPRKARAVYRQLVSCCLDRYHPHTNDGALVEPSRRHIGVQNRAERDRARAQLRIEPTEHVEFWREYLDHFHYIANVADYRQLLDHVYRLMGPVTGGQRILDAGCGNGNFGMFLFMNQVYRRLNSCPGESRPIHYTGIDFVPNALGQSRLNLTRMTEDYRAMLPRGLPTSSLMTFMYSRMDLNKALPFHDQSFDRIVCNLVIGYLQDPVSTIRELLRVLTTGGKLVLTNLKPHADLSQIYRNYLQGAPLPQELEEARRLLNNSGKIRQRESDGIFRFYERQEMAQVLAACGAVQARIYSTFGNQAYLAVVERQDTPFIHPHKTREVEDKMLRDPFIEEESFA